MDWGREEEDLPMVENQKRKQELLLRNGDKCKRGQAATEDKFRPAPCPRRRTNGAKRRLTQKQLAAAARTVWRCSRAGWRAHARGRRHAQFAGETSMGRIKKPITGGGGEKTVSPEEERTEFSARNTAGPALSRLGGSNIQTGRDFSIGAGPRTLEKRGP